MSSGQTLDTGKAVEPLVEAEYPGDSVLLHGCDVDRIARRQPSLPQHDPFGTFSGIPVHRKNFVHQSQERIVCRLDRVRTLYGDIAMQYFLQHFRIRDKTLPLGEQGLQQPLRVRFSWMRRANEIHRHI